jgi:hypothetical protein
VRFGFVVPYAEARDFAEIAALAWADAGATWWIESWWSLPRDPDGLAEVKRRVLAGPPHG